MGRRKATPFSSHAQAREAIATSLRHWYEATFKKAPAAGFAERLGPGALERSRVEQVRREREAGRHLDHLYKAMYQAAAFVRDDQDEGAATLVAYLRQLFPPRDGGRSGPFPSLRAWVERLPPDAVPPSVALGRTQQPLAGLARLVALLDDRDVLELGSGHPPHGGSRFLSDTEMAKVAILAGWFPRQDRWPNLDQATQGKIVAIVGRDVRDARAQFGRLKTDEKKAAMGVAGRRGPRPKRSAMR